MTINVITAKGPENRLGLMVVEESGELVGFTLELKVRGTQPMMACPAGEYEVKWTWSVKFQKVLPEILGVPGREKIRIHSGNRTADTVGCILLGKQAAFDVIGDSKAAMVRLEQITGKKPFKIRIV